MSYRIEDVKQDELSAVKIAWIVMQWFFCRPAFLYGSLLVHIHQGKFIPAKSEKEVFSTLKLNYLEPWERNC